MTETPSNFRYLPVALAESVHKLGIHVRRPVRGRGEGLHRSPDYGASIEFAEYRDYTPGDPPNRIDWSVFARSDRYLVRRFEEETSLRSILLLDTSESMAFRDAGRLTKWEYACYLAGGLMYALVRQGDAAGLFPFSHQLGRIFEPAGSLAGLRPMLEALEALNPSGRSDLETALVQAADRMPARSLVIVISDFLHPAEPIVRGLRRLYHEGHSLILLHVIDGGERQPGFGGVAELRELETGRRLVVEMDEIRLRYEQALDRHVASLRRACSDCLGDYHLIDTREPPEAALFKLGQGERL
jgi:uncharacterized protein (DUF58 family)